MRLKSVTTSVEKVYITGEEMLQGLLHKRAFRPAEFKSASDFEKLLGKDFIPKDFSTVGREVTEVIGKGSKRAFVLGSRSGEAEFARLIAREIIKYEANLLDTNPYLKAFEVGTDLLETWGGEGSYPIKSNTVTFDGTYTLVKGDGAIWYTAPQPVLTWPYGSLPGNEPGQPVQPTVKLPGMQQDQYYYGKYIGPGTFGGWYYGPTLAVPAWGPGQKSALALNLYPDPSVGQDRKRNRNTLASGRYRWLRDQGVTFKAARTEAAIGMKGRKPPPPNWTKTRPRGGDVEGKFRLSPKAYKGLWIIANVLGDAAEFIDLLVGASSGHVTVMRATDRRDEYWGFRPTEYGPGHRKYFKENEYLGFQYKPWVKGGIMYQKALWFINGGYEHFNLDKFIEGWIYNAFEDRALGQGSQFITEKLTPPGRGFGITIGPAI